MHRTARVAIADLTIDDYGVCVRYSGDALYNEAFAGPIDAFVIKGVLLPAPTVALVGAGDGRRRTAASPSASRSPRSTRRRCRADRSRSGATAQTVATVDLVDGVAPRDGRRSGRRERHAERRIHGRRDVPAGGVGSDVILLDARHRPHHPDAVASRCSRCSPSSWDSSPRAGSAAKRAAHPWASSRSGCCNDWPARRAG